MYIIGRVTYYTHDYTMMAADVEHTLRDTMVNTYGKISLCVCLPLTMSSPFSLLDRCWFRCR